jgi:polysaccharide export outer membrane protein
MKSCLSKAFEKEFVPVIYQIDLSNAGSFFLASQFMLQDKDLIYVSTAPAREYNKFLDTFVKPLLDFGRTGIVISREATSD